MSGQQAPDTPGAATSRGSRWRQALTPSRILALLLTAVAIVLIAENTREVKIRLLVPVVTMPLYAALLIMFVIGLLAGALLVYNRRRRRRRRERY
ncbi:MULTISPECIES: LapA family protein [unclassified Streptomyces]|uniref:LapA family protein n=1 Tax=unclassified Streptomyces TaxID=2593676 RepID=UPI002E135490|nr:LapA family protein [Streptomyces sp. NBC_01197]WSS47732.1 LapA family protein [Streptomyces sp. NBC_01180]